jgi:predicted nucleotidyltransferase
MLNAEQILSILAQNIGSLKQYGIQRIGLFGSFLRNEQNEDSDIDLLVEFEPGRKTFDNYMDLKFQLEHLLRRPVDLVIPEAVKPRLQQHILGSVRYAA